MATEVQTFSELYEIGKAASLLRSALLTAKSFSPGYMLDNVAGLSASLAEEVIRIAVEFHLDTFFGTATGDELDTLAEDHFDLKRQAGVPAVGKIEFSRPTSGFGNLLIDAGTVVQTADGTRFLTTSQILITGLSLEADARAEVTGEGGNVALGTVDNLVSAIDDSSISATNLAEFAGGLAKETDTAYRTRIRDFFITLRRGTVSAVEAGGKTVAGVVTATLSEAAFPPTLYIADITGSANAALAALVTTELLNFRPAGVPVNVIGATVVFQDITLALTFQAGFDTTDVKELVRAAVLAEVNTLSIAETLFRSRIASAGLTISGVLNVAVTTPAGDVVPAANEILRTESNRITI